ncbi:hypothetical protein A5704_24570 [Mycobacterium sp. E735]|nr:hypothetical protein A5704_24570 [Mycobacterium sp. E735]OBG62191.1 hypothetical protein A5703_21685 [Mycobacterium sp. E188]OBH34095.1 hypothetical protein A5691_08535 [Mycobacterium sp. E183]
MPETGGTLPAALNEVFVRAFLLDRGSSVSAGLLDEKVIVRSPTACFDELYCSIPIVQQVIVFIRGEFVVFFIIYDAIAYR